MSLLILQTNGKTLQGIFLGTNIFLYILDRRICEFFHYMINTFSKIQIFIHVVSQILEFL